MNTLIAAILGRRRAVMTLMVVMIVAGLYTYLTIPREADPDIDVPVFYVSIVHHGISPEDAERLLIRPMETQLRSLEGLKNITAIGSQGHAGIILEFQIDIDHDAAAADVREKVDVARAELPQEAEEPVVNEINMSLFPILVVVLSGEVPERTLYQHARRLKDRIEAIPSVLSADLAGHREELLEVVIDPTLLESHNITQAELILAVTNNNRLVAAGSMDKGNGRFDVKVPGLFQTAEDVYSLPVKVSGDAVTTLADVAEIRRTFKDATAFSRYNGKPSIALQIVKRSGANIVETNAELRKVIAEASADWPGAIKIDYALDQSQFIFEVQRDLENSILAAVALVMILVVASLGLRSGIIVGFAVPGSFLIGFLFVGMFGMTVNMMLLFGLVLTAGMVVDGAIIVVEYADRKMAEGLERRAAYILAAQRMFGPVVASTAMTLAAFLPLLLWPGVPGEFMSYLPITVCFVLAASLLTAMIFVPVIGGFIGRTDASSLEAENAKELAGGHKFDPSHVKGLAGAYIRVLRPCMNNPGKVLIASVLLMAGILYAYQIYGKGVEFFVETDPVQAIVMVSGRGNMSASEEAALVREVEAEVMKVDGIKSVFTTTGKPAAGAGFGGAGIDTPGDLIGQITIELRDYATRRHGNLILQEIRDRTAKLAGIKVEARPRDNGPATGKDVRLEVRGTTLDEVTQATMRVREHLDRNVAGLIDIEDGRPLPGIEWVLRVDRAEAGKYGADVTSVGAIIQLVTTGVLVGTYRPDDSEDEVDIRVRLPADSRTINQLDQLRVQTPKGLVPISNFVTREAAPRVSSITRTNGYYTMMVKANVPDGVLADDKVRKIDAWLKNQDWSRGVGFRFRGADEEQKESAAFLTKALVGALFLMFAILILEFNSFWQTAITLSTVVLSLFGVLIGMMVMGQTFSIIMTGTGIVALAGVVVSNAIVLIDTFNRLREAGMEIIDSIIQACAQRLRPVLLTAVTTVLGVVPMMFELNFGFFTRSMQIGSSTSAWWVQLATALVFGLTFATLLTLILTPTLLAMPTVYREWFGRIRARWWYAPTTTKPVRAPLPASFPQAAE